MDGRWEGQCTVDAWGVRWRWCVGCWGVFNLGGLGEMELLMEEVVDGGGVHAVQMDLLIDRVAVGVNQGGVGGFCMAQLGSCMW